jgi:DNA-binding winged helix-turn-helix (wHTH) protein
MIDLTPQTRDRFTLGEFLIDPGALKLSCEREPLTRRVTAKSMAVLLKLCEHAGQTLPRDTLLDLVWANTCPTPDVLTQAIKELRRALDDDQKAPRFIETIPKLGYRLLVAPEAYSLASTPLPDQIRATGPAQPVEHTGATADAKEPIKNIYLTMALALIAGLAVLGWTVRSREAPKEDVPTAQQTLSQLQDSVRLLTSIPGVEHSPALSPNGQWLAYVIGQSAQRIWIKDLATPNQVRLTQTERDFPSAVHIAELQPQFSADGLEVSYVRYVVLDHARQLAFPGSAEPEPGTPFLTPPAGIVRCELVAQRVLGGVARPLMDCPNGMVLPYSWASNNEVLISVQQRGKLEGKDASRAKGGASAQPAGNSVGIFAFNLDTGASKRLGSKADEAVFDVNPRRSPDGKYLVFRRGGNIDANLMWAHADGENPQPFAALVHSARGFDWGKPSLRAAELNSTKLAVTPADDDPFIVLALGEASDFVLHKVVLDRAKARWRTPESLGIAGQWPSAASDGALAYNVVQERAMLMQFDLRQANQAGVIVHPSTSVESAPSLSANGENLAFVSRRGGVFQVWLAERANAPRAVTTQPARFSGIAWHATGSHFLVGETRNGSYPPRLLEYDVARAKLRELALPETLGSALRVQYHSAGLLMLVSKAGKRQLLALDATFANERAALKHINWQPRWALPNVSSFQRDPVRGNIYVTKIGDNVLYRVDTTLDPQFTLRVVLPSFEPQFLWNWRVSDGQLYFSRRRPTGFALYAHDIETGQERLVRQMPTGDLALDLTAQRAIVPTPIQAEMDIARLTLPP